VWWVEGVADDSSLRMPALRYAVGGGNVSRAAPKPGTGAADPVSRGVGVTGDDVTAMLPYLSRYMGHATFDSTYYYVHTSPDFMAAYADITAQRQSLLPQVGF
jgi:hypothetical protein